MKEFVCIVFLCVSSVPGVCQSRIVADMINFKNNDGVCRVCLFNKPDAFKGDGGTPYQCEVVAVKNQTAEAVFNVPAGSYALFVFHDANGNNKMDRNFIGIPKEGYGASKNKLPFAGAPGYDENKFFVEDKGTVRLRIRLRNI
ncbi:MAG: DUF2141 domain-containing protein [Bacteroidota bacterium]|nr:DUF2141 domain-containing protein [Bacteroidota bacterium]